MEVRGRRVGQVAQHKRRKSPWGRHTTPHSGLKWGSGGGYPKSGPELNFNGSGASLCSPKSYLTMLWPSEAF